MCGRYTLRTPADQLVDLFGFTERPALSPRYNIAPSQDVLAVREGDDGREWANLRWGLIPSWADDPAIGNKMINARGETVAQKPSFKHAFRKRRCLIAADGFFEWKPTSGRSKQPVYIRLRQGGPFAFAGIWEQWKKGDEPIESCTIITTASENWMTEIHHRVPVILHERDYGLWLNPDEQSAEKLQPLLVSFPTDRLTFHPVSTVVNSPRNDTPDCVEPIEETGLLFE